MNQAVEEAVRKENEALTMPSLVNQLLQIPKWRNWLDWKICRRKDAQLTRLQRMGARSRTMAKARNQMS